MYPILENEHNWIYSHLYKKEPKGRKSEAHESRIREKKNKQTNKQTNNGYILSFYYN